MAPNINMPRRGISAALALAFGLPGMAVRAQAFPTHAVRITSPFPAGSGADAAIRILAEQLQAQWHQSLVIEPKPGASGILAVSAFKQLPVNGHELLAADVGTLSINPHAFKRLPYDPVKDLVPISLINRAAVFVAVGGNSPIKTFAEFVSAARGGSLSYASPGAGTYQQLGSEQIGHAINAKLLHVPFRDFGSLSSSLVNGDVSWGLITYATAAGLVKAGRLRLLAVADSKRFAGAPDIPTIAEAGGPTGIEISAWLALVAPAGTPVGTVVQIQKSVAEALAQRDVQQRFSAIGLVAEASTQDQLRDLIANESKRYGDLIRRIGVQLD